MHILLLRIGRLGDIVMVLPAFMEIKRLYPQAKVTFITSKEGLRLLQTLNTDVEIILYRRTLLYKILDAFRIKKLIKKQKFDHIFCFESKKRTVSWLPSSAQVLQPGNTLQHYALRCLQLVNPKIQNPHKQGYLLFNQPQTLTFPPAFAIKTNTILIGIHPSYSGYQKSNRGEEPLHRLWPTSYFAQLINQLEDYAKKHKLDLKIIMNLLPNEYTLGDSIEKESAGNLILFKPTPNLENYLAYLQRLQILITPNTGVMHLAAALNKPLIALFSREHPDDCGPFMPASRYKVLQAENYPRKHPGLANISVEAVFKETISLLNNVTQ